MKRGESYVLSSSAAESRRLARQSRLYGGVAFLDRALALRPRRVLDVGCGSGHLAQAVGARVPSAEVVGLELDAGRVAFARAQCPAANLRYLRGDLAALPFDTGRFDLVYSRFVLVQCRAPQAALAEMVRVTSPGGRVVALDAVHDGIWFSPPMPALSEVLRLVMAAMRERGAEPNQGLHLPVAMKQVGLLDVAAEVVPHAVMRGEPLADLYRDNWRATIDSLAAGLGHRLDPALIAAARRELEPGVALQWMVEVTVLAQGTRPA